jgi:hypothetical protein
VESVKDKLCFGVERALHCSEKTLREALEHDGRPVPDYARRGSD